MISEVLRAERHTATRPNTATDTGVRATSIIAQTPDHDYFLNVLI